MGTYAHHAEGLWSFCHGGSMVREHIYICRPAVVDWDGDGGLDLIVGAEDEAAKQV